MSAGRLDVVVVGAGLAGLTAADELVRRGLDVRVLEARDRVGGRTFSTTVAGQAVDLGAEHVGPSHWRARALARRLGLRLRPAGTLSGKGLWRLGGRTKVSRVPPLPPADLAATLGLFSRQSRMARRLDPAQPWMSPGAEVLDRMSLAEWLAMEGVTGGALELQTRLWEGLMHTSAERLSMLHALWMMRRSGGWVAGLRDAMGDRVDGGTQQLALGLARSLGSRVALGAAVAQVEQDEHEVAVELEGGERLSARQAIVCVPVPALPRISFSPALPPELEGMRDELGFGHATTVVVGSPSTRLGEFEVAFGHEAFGEAWRRGNTVKAVVPDLAPDGAEAAGRRIAEAFGVASADLEMRSMAWTAEPLTGGTYVVFAPGQITRYGPALTRSHGRIHFAGAERSSWPDFMEGAMESGTRAAHDALSVHRA